MHRKSKGHKASNFHESTTVEIIWTIVPFVIVVLMALPATKAVVAMKDTTNADLTVKVTGYQWKWGYDYVKGPGEGINFLSTLSTPRSQIERPAADRRTVSAGSRQPARGSGRQENPHHHHRQRRRSLMVCPGIRREAGRDPRLRARHVVQGREDRHVPRLLYRTVRQGTRVTCRSWSKCCRLTTTQSGSMARRRKWPPAPTIRTRPTPWTN